MRRIKEIIKMDPKVRVSVRILPFNSIIYTTTGTEGSIEGTKPETPRYVEPQTTSFEEVQILYEDSGVYSVPKTTAGP